VITVDGHKVAAARVWASARMPYLASALFAARVRATVDTGTVAIDEGWTISADPKVVDSLDAVELGRLILHLVFHALRDHAARATSMAVEAHTWWNRCADAEINDDLVDVNAVPASAPDLPAALGGMDHRLAEEYYGTQPQGPRPWDCGSGADGEPRPWDQPGAPCLSRQQAELMRSRTAADIQQAHQREPGTVPAGLLRWAESILPSRVDWRRVLAAEVRHAIAAVSGSVDYSYRRPSRRGASARPALLPTLFRPVPQVAVVCDTSGSMHDELLARALAEVEGLLAGAGLRAGQLRVLAVDTEVHAVSRVTRARDVVLAGGGGTDMGRGIDAAMKLRPKPSIVIVLTDGYTPWPMTGPRGARVVVALLAEVSTPPMTAPDWARLVVIDDGDLQREQA
jgi:predicted metal-dependent peptidase